MRPGMAAGAVCQRLCGAIGENFSQKTIAAIFDMVYHNGGGCEALAANKITFQEIRTTNRPKRK